MGAVFSRALTKDDLIEALFPVNNQIASIKNDMSSMKVQFNDQMSSIKNDISSINNRISSVEDALLSSR